MIQRYIYFLLLFIFFSSNNSYSQKFRHLNVENGLSSRQATSVVQDKEDFMWISTKSGVDRFDGRTIKNYNLPPAPYEYAFENFYVKIDHDSLVWVYNDVGQIYRYNYGYDRFELYFNLYNNPYRSSLWITNTCFDSNNIFWISTTTGLYNIKDNELHSIAPLKNSAKYVSAICQKQNSELIYSIQNNFFLLNTENDEVIPLLIDLQNINLIESLYYDDETQKLWIGTLSQGALCYDFESGVVKNLSTINFNFPKVPIQSFCSVNKQQMLIGTDGLGVWSINQNTLKVDTFFRDDEDQKASLNGNGIYDIFKDKENRIWISTYTGGVNILDPSLLKFTNIRHETNSVNSPSNSTINAITEDPKGNLWFATDNGISKLEKKSQQWIHFLKNIDDETNVFLDICEDQYGNMWAGSYSLGVYVISPKNKIINHYLQSDEKSSIGTNYIFQIQKDSANNLWLGGHHGSFSQFNSKTNSFVKYSNIEVNSIIEKDIESLYLGTNQGVYIFNKESGKTNLISRRLFVYCVFTVDHQTLYYGTRGSGLFIYDPKSSQTRSFTTQEGLPSNHIYSIEQKGDFLWIATDNGLSRFSIKDETFQNFSIEDGISDKTYIQNSVYKKDDGTILFGSYNGITMFNPDEIEPPEKKAKIYLEEFRLFNKTYYPFEEGSPLKAPINNTKKLNLKHYQHSFSIDFTSISFFNSEKVKYSWKLEGLDNEWNNSSFNRTANYTNLTKGVYIFKLRALDYSTDKILDEREIAITVDPPLWNTTLAKMLYVLFIILIVWWITIYAQVKIKKKNSDEKISFFTNTAHDIRTPLSLVSAPLNELKFESELSKEGKYYLDLSINNLKKLTTLINQLLDFQKSDVKKTQLVVSKLNIIELTRQKVLLFQSIAKKKNITLTFDCTLSSLKKWMDQSKFDKILENLLSNAIKYTLNNGEVKVSLTEDKNFWQLNIKDNGIGIPKKAKKNIFKGFFRGENAINSKVSGTGIGLLLVKNYVLLHKGKIQFDSEENNGSEFKIQFRHGKKHFDKQTIFLKGKKEIPSEDENQETEIKQVPLSEKNNRNLPKLFIVEDNDELREYLATSLKSTYKITTAENGKIALEEVAKVRPDIMISDVKMPIIDGITLSHHIRNNFGTSHIPIILLSALNDKDSILKGLKSGVDDYVTKPFDISILKSKLNNLLKNRQRLKDRFLIEPTQITKDKNYNNVQDQAFLEKSLQIVQKHIEDPHFSIPDFAKELGVSKSLLYEKLKALIGQTPNDYIKIIKLKKAVELLQTGQYNVNEIATLTGFDDPRYFSTVFRKHYGKPPSKYFV